MSEETFTFVIVVNDGTAKYYKNGVRYFSQEAEALMYRYKNFGHRITMRGPESE